MNTTETNDLLRMDIVCQEQHLNRNLRFPDQFIQLKDKSNIDLKRTLQLNDALRYTLSDCTIFLMHGEQNISLGVLNSQNLASSGNDLVFTLSEKMKSENLIMLSFFRIPVKPKEETITTVKQIVSQGLLSSASTSSATILSGSAPNTPFLTSVQSQLKKRKQEEIQTQVIAHSLPQKRPKISVNLDQDEEEGDSFKQEDLSKQNSDQKEENSNSKNSKGDDEKLGAKKSQERTIGEALEMVVLWRDRQEFYKHQSISKDFQQVAEEIGISKKTLDYYYLELRSAEYFHFDFDKNLHNKMGMLRDFVNEAKKNYRKQFKSSKIPRPSMLRYRIPKDYHINKQENDNGINVIPSFQSQKLEQNGFEQPKKEEYQLIQQPQPQQLHQYPQQFQQTKLNQLIPQQFPFNNNNNHQHQQLTHPTDDDNFCFQSVQYPQQQIQPSITQQKLQYPFQESQNISHNFRQNQGQFHPNPYLQQQPTYQHQQMQNLIQHNIPKPMNNTNNNNNNTLQPNNNYHQIFQPHFSESQQTQNKNLHNLPQMTSQTFQHGTQQYAENGKLYDCKTEFQQFLQYPKSQCLGQIQTTTD